jgi:NAD(P)-dependent dehydrogenase (short-subunit alcohol dehydrogenase family)
MSVATVDLSGRVCVVTGATSGIGFEAARALARSGATVAVIGRNGSRTDETVRALRAENPSAKVRGYVADLALRSEVRRLSEELLGAYPRIHVLVNNAGALYMRRETTSEGVERTWALNVVAPFLLTYLLGRRLGESAPARIVNVSSGAHLRAHLDLEDPEGARRYRGFQAYSRSKLALILWTYELARRLEGSRVTANALHPGFVATRWALNNPGATGGAIRLFARLFGLSPEAGARTTVYLGSSPEVAAVSGRYFVKSRPVRSSAASYDAGTGQALWTLLCARTGVPPDAPWVGRPAAAAQGGCAAPGPPERGRGGARAHESEDLGLTAGSNRTTPSGRGAYN